MILFLRLPDYDYWVIFAQGDQSLWTAYSCLICIMVSCQIQTFSFSFITLPQDSYDTF